jgi:hypothetical protein
MLHVQGRDVADARAFARRWSLRQPDGIEKMIAFVTHLTSRTYIAVYETGKRLVASWARSDAARYRRLLTEQLTTGDLLAG